VVSISMTGAGCYTGDTRQTCVADLAFTDSLHYSYRSARVGAIRDALRAGT
jgi:hypothetical protein